MTHEEILKKALLKVQNKVKLGSLEHFMFILQPMPSSETSALRHWMNGIVLSCDFAKAFWGEDRYDKIPIKIKGRMVGNVRQEKDHWVPGYTKMVRRKIPGWKYHLQQMVLEEDPIIYLAKFL